MKLRSLAVAAGMVMAMAPAISHGAAEGPWPLGTFVLQPGHPECLVGYMCNEFAITGCPNVSRDALGVLARATPPKDQSVRGLVVFFSGHEGEDWWSSPTLLAGRFLSRLRTRDGFVVVQVKWLDHWLKAPLGEDSGSAHLACRPGTVVDWIYQDLYLRLGITAGPGECGFCITGNSGGATQAAYALSHYGLDGILGAAVLTSGPPHAAEEKGCLPGFPGYEYDSSGMKIIDLSFGFSDEGSDLGPCILADPSWGPRWQEESVDTGANDASYPRTRVEFITGSEDNGTAPIHAGDFRDLLQQDPNNHVTWLVVDGMRHTIQGSPEGLAALEASLLGP
jgi:hypothetical protein